MRLRLSVRGTLTGLLACVGFGCQPLLYVWLATESTPDVPIFEFGSTRGRPEMTQIRSLALNRCAAPAPRAEEALWHIVDTTGQAEVWSVSYGLPPRTFVANRPAPPLEPGCYRVDVAGGSPGTLRFRIEAEGTTRRVREFSS